MSEERPLDVVQVCRVAWPSVGGMESAVAGLSRALVARGHRVRWVTLSPGPGRWGDIPIVRLAARGPRRYPFALDVRRAVEGADVIHVHGLDGLADLLVGGGRRVGISTHGGYLHTERWGLLKAALLHTWTRRTLRRASAVWPTSATDAARLAAALPGPCEVLPDGVDLEPTPPARRPEPGRWLVLGRVDVHKGLEDLARALVLHASADPRPFRVEVIGPIAARAVRDRVESILARSGRAIQLAFRGLLTPGELADAASRCELALMPSRSEGFGMALLELLARGAVVLASDIPAHRELVDHRRTGFLVRWTDARSGSRALAELRDRDLAGIGAAAAASARSRSWDAVASRAEEAYRALLRGPRPG